MRSGAYLGMSKFAYTPIL